MNFLNPAFLIGLPLLAVPVVIHLLSRRQQKKISWGAMRFLIQAATRKRRLWRLTDLLLLLLRTAAFLFFIFALARPLLPATWLGGGVPREVILVLDQSMSMWRKADGTSLFELQLQKANNLLGDLTAADTVRVMLAGESPEWLTEPSLATQGALRKLRARINELKPTLGAADLLACIREAADIEEPSDKSARVIVVISDGQRFGWRIDDRPLWAAVQNRIQQASVPTAVSVEVLEAPRPQGNLSVNSIKALRAFAAIDQSVNLTATIQNHSATASGATLLTWRANGESIGVTTVPELAPGASTMLSLEHSFASAGSFSVSCHLEAADELLADNDGYLLVDIFERLPVLVVEDPPAEGPADAAFILAALGAQQSSDTRWRSVFEPTVIESPALASTDVSRFHAVILATVQSLPPGAIEKLEAHVQNGGGVWVALGERTEDATFNGQFYRGGLGLSPAKLAGAVGDPNDRERFFTVRAASDAHPATVLLSDFQRLDLDRARIYRRHQFDLGSGKDISILLQAQGGEAVVIERKLGRGRVIVQGIPLGVSWSTLPLCQAYVAMIHEWLWYLSEPSLPKRNLAVGETLAEKAADGNRTAELIAPDGQTHEVAASVVAGAAQFRYNATRLPGDYALRDKNDEKGVKGRFYVQRTAGESDLTLFTDTDEQQIAAAGGVHLNAGLGAVTAKGNVQIPRHPLEGILLTVLAVVLVGEAAMAGWTTHRRTLRVEPVTM
jgi:hypothetical protein